MIDSFWKMVLTKNNNQSSTNAVKHWIYSNSYLSTPEKKLYKHTIKSLFLELQPNWIIEETIVYKIAKHVIQLSRITQAESEYISKESDSVDWWATTIVMKYVRSAKELKEYQEYEAQKMKIPEKKKFKNLEVHDYQLDTLLRFDKYDTSIQNKIIKLTKELYKLKQMKNGKFDYIDLNISK